MTNLPHPHERGIWNTVRWIAILPVAATTYALVVTTLIGGVNTLSLRISGDVGYAVIFAVSTLAAVSAGARTAPFRRFPVACVLACLIAGTLTFFAVGAALQKDWDPEDGNPSLWPAALGQVAAALAAVLLFWRGGKGKG